MIAVYVLIPLLSAFLGWLIIRLSFLLLFRPVRPVKFASLTLQGALYKNVDVWKSALARFIANEVNGEALMKNVASTSNIDRLKPELNEHIDVFLKVRLKEAMPMIGMLIGDRTIGQLKALFMEELESLFPSVMNSYMSHLKEDLDLNQLVKEKLDAFPPERIEKIIRENCKSQLTKLTTVAAFVGLIVGLIQVLIVILFLS
jgi:uncharacterized membrane protein YheB (UPF0754 family)